EVLAATEPPLGRALRAFAPAALREDAVAALARRFDRARPPPTGVAARRALAAFLRLTDGDEPWQIADRALTLHMLEGHAPAFFAAADVGPALVAAVARLVELPEALPPGLDAPDAMARVP